MAGLQRSAISFRRQGSSGFVWDERFLSQELNIQLRQEDLEEAMMCSKDVEKTSEIKRIKSDGGRNPDQVVKVAEQVEDPPSPRMAARCFCGIFGRPPALPGKSK